MSSIDVSSKSNEESSNRRTSVFVSDASVKSAIQSVKSSSTITAAGSVEEPRCLRQIESPRNVINSNVRDKFTFPKSNPYPSLNLICWSTNANSLDGKRIELAARIKSSAKQHKAPHIIAITETKFNETSIAILSGYQLFRADRKADYSG